MPIQAIASASADDPGCARLTWAHPVAAAAARLCRRHGTPYAELVGLVACQDCWDDALLTDFLFAHEHDLPLDLTVDPSYVDEVAVQRFVRGEPLDLTDVERAEANRRLARIRKHHNTSARYWPSMPLGVNA